MIIARNDSEQTILQRCVELLAPFVFDGSDGADWQDADCMIGTENPVGAAASLLEEYDQDELTAIGIIETTNDGAHRLVSELTQQAGPVLVLRGTSNDLPTALLTGHLTVVNEHLPLQLVIQDAETQNLLRSRDHMLFLCPTVEHVAVFRALGVPAAPIFGVSCLKGPGLRRLATELANASQAEECQTHEEQPREQAGITSTPSGDNRTIKRNRSSKDRRQPDCIEITLVLANWNPGPWIEQHTTEIRTTAGFLAKSQRLLEIECGTTLVWSPSAQERSDLEFVLRHGDKTILWNIVRDSVETSNYSPSHFADPAFQPQEPVVSYVGALRELLRQSSAAARHLGDLADWMKAVEDYERFSFHDVVEPLVSRASAPPDPTDPVLASLVAQTASVLHRQTPEVLRTLGDWARVSGDTNDGEFPKGILERHMRISDQLLKQIKVLRK